MSNVEAIRFLINEANQLTADTPKKVRKHTIDLLAKAVREVAGSNMICVKANVYTDCHGQLIWNVRCSNGDRNSNPYAPFVNLYSTKTTGIVITKQCMISTWDNAAEVFVRAIELLSQNILPIIPNIQQTINAANTPKVDPPKFDPKQAIWDAGGWSVSEDGSVSIVGECAKAYVEYGKMGYIAERHPDREMVISVIGPIQNPRHVDTDRYRVIAVLPNRVYVAKKNGTDSWVVFTKDSRTSDTTIYYHYDSAVKDAIKFSQETS